jgi:hypothetical protein
MVQSNHATRGITSIYPQGHGIPNIVLIGVPDVNALNRVKTKLSKYQIPHYCWVEPDYDFGFTAIATAAILPEQKEPLLNYRLWKMGEEPTGLLACREKRPLTPPPILPSFKIQDP